jgi:uncharacterized protein (TIGR03437 family)
VASAEANLLIRHALRVISRDTSREVATAATGRDPDQRCRFCICTLGADLPRRDTNASPSGHVGVTFIRIEGTAADPRPKARRTGSSAASTPVTARTQAFAPGTLMTVFGTQLSTDTASAGVLPLPISRAGVSATVNGVSAPIYYVSPGQINVQVPYETGIGTAVLGVNNNGQVASFPFVVAAAAPGLFTAADGSLVPSANATQGQTAVAYITGDGDTTTFLITGASPATGTAVSKLPRPRLPVTVTVGGAAATVAFVGIPPGLVGVTQLNFIVPTTVPVGVQPVVVSVGGIKTQAGTLTVTQ